MSSDLLSDLSDTPPTNFTALGANSREDQPDAIAVHSLRGKHLGSSGDGHRGGRFDRVVLDAHNCSSRPRICRWSIPARQLVSGLPRRRA